MNYGWVDFLKILWKLLGKDRKKFLLITLVLFAAWFYVIVPPLVLGQVVDFFVKYKVGDSLAPFVILVLFFGISNAVVALLRITFKRKSGDVVSDVSYNTKVLAFEKLLNFSVKWHDSELTGEKTQKIQNGVKSLNEIGGLFSNTILGTAASVIGASVVFLFLEPIYATFFVVYSVLFTIGLLHFYKRIKEINEKYYGALEKAGGTFVEGLSNLLTIKAMGAKQGFKRKVERKENATRLYEYEKRKIGLRQLLFFQIYNSVAYVVFLLGVGYGVAVDLLTPGAVIVFFGYLIRLQESADAILAVYQKIIEYKSSINRLIPIFAEKEMYTTGNKLFPKNWKEISLIKANFNYTDNRKKITQIILDVTIRKGSKIGIIGKTGSGKSTFAKLLAGLYQINSGEYRIGHRNFYEISHQKITENISLVLQESEMFNLSLRENITLMRKVNKKMFEKAIKIAQLEEVVLKLPKGINTIIGEKGYRLSGGERQRVGIARAIVRDSQILIFDEASSSLDTKTEKLIHNAFRKYLKNKTIILIAHRTSTLKDTDKIYTFKKGQIISERTYSK